MGEFTYFFVLASIGGFALGIIIMIMYSKLGLNRDQQKAKLILEEANIKSDSTLRQAILDAKTQTYDLKLAAEKEIKESKQTLQDVELKLNRREDSLNFRSETLTSKEKELDLRNNQVTEKLNVLEKMEANLKEKIDGQVVELERIANMTQTDAKNELMDIVRVRTQNEVEAYIRDQEEEAKAKSSSMAKEIIGLAIQRYAQEETLERTVSVVGLPNEEMKGRIIGREGRNIRAIEAATGVEIIVDDTPEAIILSCFDPVRREIARLSLHRLVADGRIHPARIEEVVSKVKKQIEEEIIETGKRTAIDLGIHGLHPEMIRMIGKMKYRSSYGQNLLQHARETANLCAIMAAELGLNVKKAKRAGLLHDIGKVPDDEPELPHALLGMKLAEKYKEKPDICNAIGAHHDEIEMTTLLAPIVQVCDAISGARPGARREIVEAYIKRLNDLEQLAMSYPGVLKTYAIQAGRELRVIVGADKVDDVETEKLSAEIAKKIQDEMTYPGQVKITVIRETRAVSFAK